MLHAGAGIILLLAQFSTFGDGPYQTVLLLGIKLKDSATARERVFGLE
ncbi:MAG: hypothetical protein SWO11_21955 [Thermodesulfobacteriota bacterium]|nr:hypothetical protein [Thermodesulfobacteriota bacterium]